MIAKAWEYKTGLNGNYTSADSSENGKATCDRYGHVINQGGFDQPFPSQQEDHDHHRLRAFLDSLESRLYTLMHR